MDSKKSVMDFNDGAELVYVDSAQDVVCCKGVSKNLGHPAVYLRFDGNSNVRCYYCGREFRRDSE